MRFEEKKMKNKNIIIKKVEATETVAVKLWWNHAAKQTIPLVIYFVHFKTKFSVIDKITCAI